MELSIATDYFDTSPDLDRQKEILTNIAEAGFTHVHWCHEWASNYLYDIAEMKLLKKLYQERGLKTTSLHASAAPEPETRDFRFQYSREFLKTDDRKNYTSFEEAFRQAGVSLIINRLQLAHELEGKAVVLHLQVPHKSISESKELEQKYWEQVFKSFDELEKYSKEYGVRIAIETLLGMSADFHTYIFNKVCDRYHSDYIGLCFDTGHVHIMSDSLDYLMPFQKRFIETHCTDNFGVGYSKARNFDQIVCNADIHLRPYEGNIEWDKTAQFIAGSNCSIPLTLELTCKPWETEKEFLKKSYESGVKLTNQVLSYR